MLLCDRTCARLLFFLSEWADCVIGDTRSVRPVRDECVASPRRPETDSKQGIIPVVNVKGQMVHTEMRPENKVPVVILGSGFHFVGSRSKSSTKIKIKQTNNWNYSVNSVKTNNRTYNHHKVTPRHPYFLPGRDMCELIYYREERE